jgi:hypothetical protein
MGAYPPDGDAPAAQMSDGYRSYLETYILVPRVVRTRGGEDDSVSKPPLLFQSGH